MFVEIIQIKSDYFSPFDIGMNKDRRKLSIGLYEFVFERQNCLYAQSIDKIKHVDEQLYSSIVENKIVDTRTNTLFNINDLTLKNIEINKPIKSGIILYLQNFEKPPLYRSRYSTNFPPGCLTVAKNLNEKLGSHIPIGQSICIFKIQSKPTHFGYEILSISIEFGSIEKVLAMIKDYQRSLM